MDYVLGSVSKAEACTSDVHGSGECGESCYRKPLEETCLLNDKR